MIPRAKVRGKSSGTFETEPLVRVLKGLRRVLKIGSRGDQSVREEMIEGIDCLIQSGEKGITKSRIDEVIDQTLEVLSSVLDDVAHREKNQKIEKVEKNFSALEDAFVASKILEKATSFCRSLEHARFFMAEVSSKISRVSEEKDFLGPNLPGLLERVEREFAEVSEKSLQKISSFGNIEQTYRDSTKPSPFTSPAKEGFADHSAPKLSSRLISPSKELPASYADALIKSPPHLHSISLTNLPVCPSPTQPSSTQLIASTAQETSRFSATLPSTLVTPQKNLCSKMSSCSPENNKIESPRSTSITPITNHVLSSSGNPMGIPPTIASSAHSNWVKLIELRRVQRLEIDRLGCEVSALRSEATALETTQKLNEERKNFSEFLKEKLACSNEETARLRAEASEIPQLRERLETQKAEIARLSATRERQNGEFITFHSELKKLKERMKSLLSTNDELLNEKLFYEAKVERLEAKIADLAYRAGSARPEETEKLRGENQKLREMNRRLQKNFRDFSPLDETLRKSRDRNDFDDSSVKKGNFGAKILRFGDEI